MPTSPTVPPAARFFARLEKFQCACPACGRVMTSDQDQGYVESRRRVVRKNRDQRRGRTVATAKRLVWNPITQRLICPWCRTSFVAGLLLYPVGSRGKGHDTPPDARPTYRERMALRRLGEGWCSDAQYARGQPVNVHVPNACRCPDHGWAAGCPIHGTGEQTVPTPGGGGESETIGVKS